MMHGRGKSSPVIVARKPANKAEPDSVTAAESVERRAGAKGNTNQHSTYRTQCRARVILALASIRQAVVLDCQYPRWEPYAGKLQVRVWAGARGNSRPYRDPPNGASALQHPDTAFVCNGSKPEVLTCPAPRPLFPPPEADIRWASRHVRLGANSGYRRKKGPLPLTAPGW